MSEVPLYPRRLRGDSGGRDYRIQLRECLIRRLIDIYQMFGSEWQSSLRAGRSVAGVGIWALPRKGLGWGCPKSISPQGSGFQAIGAITVKSGDRL
jgi:hypothetical protein